MSCFSGSESARDAREKELEKELEKRVESHF